MAPTGSDARATQPRLSQSHQPHTTSEGAKPPRAALACGRRVRPGVRGRGVFLQRTALLILGFAFSSLDRRLFLLFDHPQRSSALFPVFFFLSFGLLLEYCFVNHILPLSPYARKNNTLPATQPAPRPSIEIQTPIPTPTNTNTGLSQPSQLRAYPFGTPADQVQATPNPTRRRIVGRRRDKQAERPAQTSVSQFTPCHHELRIRRR